METKGEINISPRYNKDSYLKSIDIYIPKAVLKLYWSDFKDSIKIIIHAPVGSYAEKFAKKQYSFRGGLYLGRT